VAPVSRRVREWDVLTFGRSDHMRSLSRNTGKKHRLCKETNAVADMS
jgi:hypothetical protein